MTIGLALGAAQFATGGITNAIKSLYRIGGDINDFFDHHIDELKTSDNNTVAQTGRVIESAKYGFGLGYMSSVVIIATGQLLLGNSLLTSVTAASGTVLSAVTLSNPIAMTCAAVGAIYYGWGALSSKEQEAILDKLTKGLEIGVELIKSILQFLVSKTKELLSSKSISEFKVFIKEYAAKFGKTLFDVTGAMADFVKGAAEKAGEMTVKAGEFSANTLGNTTVALKGAYDKTGDAVTAAADAASGAFKGALDKTGNKAATLKQSTKQALGWQNDKDPSKGDTTGST
ncbi:MAG: hypothetical protein KA207_13120 [Burkholderiaceae bacterium]|nr:hypothetical protein [Burkholderiaceae bacterium]